MSDDLGRSGTPRPDWESASKETNSDFYSNAETTTKAKVIQLTKDLIEAKTAGGPNYITISDPLPDDHPAYLSTDKKSIRNRKFTPEETATLIKELWKSKIALEKVPETNISP